MSNSFLKIIFAIVLLGTFDGCCLWFVINNAPKAEVHSTKTFTHIQDTPVVNSLDDYYELIKKGKVELEDGTLFLQDLTIKERQQLQFMLRTP